MDVKDFNRFPGISGLIQIFNHIRIFLWSNTKEVIVHNRLKLMTIMEKDPLTLLVLKSKDKFSFETEIRVIIAN